MWQVLQLLLVTFIMMLFALLSMGFGWFFKKKPLQRGCSMPPPDTKQKKDCPVCGASSSTECKNSSGTKNLNP